MDKLSYVLPVYEGPLDLLLQLISKNKIDIYDIPIHTLLEQYMEKISQMQEADMDISSEFLEMAARLIHIKSVMLLPKYEEEAEKLKEELTGQLIEYRECRMIAKELSKLISFDTFTRQPLNISFDLTYKLHHETSQLLEKYISAIGRGKRKLPPPKDSFSGIVERKIVSVNSRIVFILRSLHKNEKVTYKSLLYAQKGKSELVATFLALLELVKGKRVILDDTQDGICIHLIGKNKVKAG